MKHHTTVSKRHGHRGNHRLAYGVFVLMVALATGALSFAPDSWAKSDGTRNFVVKNDGGSKVTFVSDAPLETITGVSSHVSGDIKLNADNLSALRAKITVPVATLRSGNDLRDEHMRSEKWLDAKKYPNATFEITRIKGAKKMEAGKEVRFDVSGKFTIHGVTKQVSAKARAKLIPLSKETKASPGIDSDVLRVRAKFKVKLEDHGVSVPKIVRLKVANEITVHANIRAVVAKKQVAKKKK